MFRLTKSNLVDISTVYVETVAEQHLPQHNQSEHGHPQPHVHANGSTQSTSALVSSPKSDVDRCHLPGDGRGHCRHYSHSTEITPLMTRRNSQRDAYFDVFMHHHDHSHAAGHCDEEEVEETKDKAVQLLGVLVS